MAEKITLTFEVGLEDLGVAYLYSKAGEVALEIEESHDLRCTDIKIDDDKAEINAPWVGEPPF